MTRLDKKCFMASAGIHAGVMLLLFIAPMIWVSKRHEVSLPRLTFIPSRLVDGAMSAGGSPTARSTPAPVAQPERSVLAPPAVSKPEVKPKLETQSKPLPQKSPQPIASEKKMAKLEESDTSPTTKPAKHKIELSFKRDTASTKRNSAAEARAQSENNARAAQKQFTSRLNSILGAIGQGVSSGTSIEIPGPGGAAYADYGQWVEKVYKDAWSPPNDLADDLATVTATVVILRNGSVESFKLIKRSGYAALDKSVERLRNITFVAKFPEGALDEKRSFIIDFNLTAKN